MKFIISTVTACVVLLVVTGASHSTDPMESLFSKYNITIPDIDKTVGSGPVSGQQGTTITIDPSIYKLFPEVSSLPQTINLTEYKLTNLTFNDLMDEWERREKAQSQPAQPVVTQALQTIGFGQTPGFTFGGLPFGGVSLPDSGLGGQALQSLQGLLPGVTGSGAIPQLWPQSAQATLSTGGAYPWMSTYWTASATLPEWQTPSNPLAPLLGPNAQSLGGTGLVP